ncbi:MAG: hypothetical protein AB1632_05125 [Nitrospirota bacterium]
MNTQKSNIKYQKSFCQRLPSVFCFPGNSNPGLSKNPELLNEKGIALVMVLILALIALAIVSALIYMSTIGTTLSGAQKFYRTTEEASFGGAEIAAEYLSNRGALVVNIPAPGVGIAFAVGCNCGDPYVYTDNIDLMTNARSRRCDKMCNPTSDWSATGAFSCDDNALVAGLQISLDPTINPDFGPYTLGVAPNTFDIFTKIVDTVQGNSDVGGIVTSGELGGAGVVASNSGLVNPPHQPYLYRMEVQAQSTNNPRERSRLSILYAY